MNNPKRWPINKTLLNESLSSTYTPFLVYHSITADNASVTNDPYSLTESQFASQMRFLYDQGYTCLSFPNVLRSSMIGEAKPNKAFVLTFDDGYNCIYTLAYPILRKYGFAATVFLVSDLTRKEGGCIDEAEPPRLTWEQIKALSAYGFSFGSHTCSHSRLTDLNDEQIRHELFDSKEALQAGFGQEIQYLAYPYGESKPAIRQIAIQAGYQAAFGTHTGEPGPFNIWRTGISSKDSMRVFILKLTRWYNYYLKLRGWVRENTFLGQYSRRIKIRYRQAFN